MAAQDIPITLSMLRNSGYRRLGSNGWRFLFFLMSEYSEHGEKQKGRLHVTDDQLIKAGASRKQIPRAIADLCATGLVKMTRQSNGQQTVFYELTWLRPFEIRPGKLHPDTQGLTIDPFADKDPV
jgi:hypothetical protein